MVHTPLAEAVPTLVPRALQMATMKILLRPPEVAAAVVLTAAAAARTAPGAFCTGMGVPIPDDVLPPNINDDATAQRLWQVTAKLIAAHA
jgi:hypothetical protein